MKYRPPSHGMKVLLPVWVGQLVSTLGSGLTGFSLGVWVYQETASTILLALNMLASILPNLIVSPFAGALVDRWDQRRATILFAIFHCTEII